MIAIVAEEAESDVQKLIDGAGPITGLFVILLIIALVIIFRSMGKQMRKIDSSLPMGPDDVRLAEDREAQDEAVERGRDEQPPA